MSYASLLGLPDARQRSPWWTETRAELDMEHEPRAELASELRYLGEPEPEYVWGADDSLLLIYPGGYVEWSGGAAYFMRDLHGDSINTCGEVGCAECALTDVTLGAGFSLDQYLDHL